MLILFRFSQLVSVGLLSSTAIHMSYKFFTEIYSQLIFVVADIIVVYMSLFMTLYVQLRIKMHTQKDP